MIDSTLVEGGHSSQDAAVSNPLSFVSNRGALPLSSQGRIGRFKRSWKQKRRLRYAPVARQPCCANGPGVTRFAPGDAVYGARGEKFAAHAEFACVAEDGFIARKPATMTFEEAGTVFVGAACSLYFLRRANVKPGERVLVHGASGSLGVFAVQLAKHFGAHVTAVCSSANVHLGDRSGPTA